jgi:hypothetical protein
MIICGVIVALGGAAQIWKGVKTMRGADRAELARLMNESDVALAEAQRLLSEASPAFQQLLGDVDKLGLGVFRAQQKQAATKTSELIGRTVAQFRLAEEKLEAAQKVNRSGRLKQFLDVKIVSYDRVAQSLAVNQEIVDLVLDESITDMQVLLPKLQEAAARRDALEKEAQAASEESKEISRQIQGSAAK